MPLHNFHDDYQAHLSDQLALLLLPSVLIDIYIENLCNKVVCYFMFTCMYVYTVYAYIHNCLCLCIIHIRIHWLDFYQICSYSTWGNNQLNKSMWLYICLRMMPYSNMHTVYTHILIAKILFKLKMALFFSFSVV